MLTEAIPEIWRSSARCRLRFSTRVDNSEGAGIPGVIISAAEKLMRASDRPSHTLRGLRIRVAMHSKTRAHLHLFYGTGAAELNVRPSPNICRRQLR